MTSDSNLLKNDLPYSFKGVNVFKNYCPRLIMIFSISLHFHWYFKIC